MNSTISMSGRILTSAALLAGVALTFALSASVASAQVAPTCSISANPSSVTYSGSSYTSVVLNWNSQNATSANLTNVGSVSTNGSQTFYPSVTTTYVLNIYNAQGQSAQCQTVVTVSGSSSGAPSCWVTLSNYGGSVNQPATLSWGSNNATSASISPNVGSISTSGSQTVYPSGNQLYTMTVYNSQGQSATCQTSQSGQPGYGNLSCSIYANPSTIQNGQSSNLTWNSTGANTALLSDSLGNVATNGSLTVRPNNSRTYTLTVSNNQGQTQTCDAYITVSGTYYPQISLDQIPYTGFDFGPIGNIAYWAVLALFALAAGYLIVYYLPAQAGLSGRGFRLSLVNSNRSATNTRVAVPAIFSREAHAHAPAPRPTASGTLEKLPVVRMTQGDAGARDSMDFEGSENGAPRIVITRK